LKFFLKKSLKYGNFINDASGTASRFWPALDVFSVLVKAKKVYIIGFEKTGIAGEIMIWLNLRG